MTTWECQGCGSREDLAAIQARGHLSCCPERKMVPISDAIQTASTPTGGGDLDVLSREDRDQIADIVAGIKNGRYDAREDGAGRRTPGGPSLFFRIPSDDMVAILRALQSPAPGRGGQQGASSSMTGLSRVEPASGLNPPDFDPSRITLEGIENMLWELSIDCDTEADDAALFRNTWSRLQEYRPEVRRIIAATKGHWSAWSEEELDSDPSDPLVGRTTEWYVGFWRTGEPEADTYVRTGSGRSAERIAKELATDLNEMVSLADRARDQRASREDAKQPRPEAASPVGIAEAPSGDDDWALTIARSLIGGTEHAVAEALRHADACGYMRGHEAGAKAKAHPAPTTGGEAPGRDDGWVLVPREPTEAMLVAGRIAADAKWGAYTGGRSALDGMEFFVRDGYRAMLSASPRSSQKEEGDA